MKRLGLYRLAAPNGNCIGCGLELGEKAWRLLEPGIDPAFFMAQNGGLCAECVLGGLSAQENSWEVREDVWAWR